MLTMLLQAPSTLNCRLCGHSEANNDEEEQRFTNCLENETLLKHMEQFLAFKIAANDDLHTKLVCFECKSKLAEFAKFDSIVKQNQQILSISQCINHATQPLHQKRVVDLRQLATASGPTADDSDGEMHLYVSDSDSDCLAIIKARGARSARIEDSDSSDSKELARFASVVKTCTIRLVDCTKTKNHATPEPVQKLSQKVQTTTKLGRLKKQLETNMSQFAKNSRRLVSEASLDSDNSDDYMESNAKKPRTSLRHARLVAADNIRNDALQKAAEAAECAAVAAAEAAAKAVKAAKEAAKEAAAEAAARTANKLEWFKQNRNVPLKWWFLESSDRRSTYDPALALASFSLTEDTQNQYEKKSVAIEKTKMSLDGPSERLRNVSERILQMCNVAVQNEQQLLPEQQQQPDQTKRKEQQPSGSQQTPENRQEPSLDQCAQKPTRKKSLAKRRATICANTSTAAARKKQQKPNTNTNHPKSTLQTQKSTRIAAADPTTATNADETGSANPNNTTASRGHSGQTAKSTTAAAVDQTITSTTSAMNADETGVANPNNTTASRGHSVLTHIVIDDVIDVDDDDDGGSLLVPNEKLTKIYNARYEKRVRRQKRLQSMSGQRPQAKTNRTNRTDGTTSSTSSSTSCEPSNCRNNQVVPKPLSKRRYSTVNNVATVAPLQSPIHSQKPTATLAQPLVVAAADNSEPANSATLTDTQTIGVLRAQAQDGVIRIMGPQRRLSLPANCMDILQKASLDSVRKQAIINRGLRKACSRNAGGQSTPVQSTTLAAAPPGNCCVAAASAALAKMPNFKILTPGELNTRAINTHAVTVSSAPVPALDAPVQQQTGDCVQQPARRTQRAMTTHEYSGRMPERNNMPCVLIPAEYASRIQFTPVRMQSTAQSSHLPQQQHQPSSLQSFNPSICQSLSSTAARNAHHPNKQSFTIATTVASQTPASVSTLARASSSRIQCRFVDRPKTTNTSAVNNNNNTNTTMPNTSVVNLLSSSGTVPFLESTQRERYMVEYQRLNKQLSQPIQLTALTQPTTTTQPQNNAGTTAEPPTVMQALELGHEIVIRNVPTDVRDPPSQQASLNTATPNVTNTIATTLAAETLRPSRPKVPIMRPTAATPSVARTSAQEYPNKFRIQMALSQQMPGHMSVMFRDSSNAIIDVEAAQPVVLRMLRQAFFSDKNVERVLDVFRGVPPDDKTMTMLGMICSDEHIRLLRQIRYGTQS